MCRTVLLIGVVCLLTTGGLISVRPGLGWCWAPVLGFSVWVPTMDRSTDHKPGTDHAPGTDDGPGHRQWALSPDGVLGYGLCPGAPCSSGRGWSVGTWCGGGQWVPWCAFCLRLLWCDVCCPTLALSRAALRRRLQRVVGLVSDLQPTRGPYTRTISPLILYRTNRISSCSR